MIGFLVGVLLVVAIVWVVAKGVAVFARGVHQFASTPKQYVCAWLAVPAVVLAVVAVAGLLVAVAGWLHSPSWDETGRALWCVAVGGVCVAVVAALVRVGGFGQPLPTAEPVPDVVVARYPDDPDPYRVPGDGVGRADRLR